MIRRVGLAIGGLLIGIAPVAAIQVLPVRMCAETCPDWFSILAVCYYLFIPLAWLGLGVAMGRPGMPRETKARGLLGLGAISVGVGIFLVVYGVRVARGMS